MSRSLIGLITASSLLLGLSLGYFITTNVAWPTDQYGNCDAVCFAKLDDLFWLSIGVGVASALVLTVAVWLVIRRFVAKPS